GGTRALVVYGGGSAVRSGAVGRAVRSLHAAGFDTFNLEGIQPNPADDRVREGIELVRMHDIDIIIAVGGGSVIDTSKAIALGALYDGDFWDFYCGKATPERALPVGVVLTIPAAGSEGSGNSVITLREVRNEDGEVVSGPVKLSLRTESVLRPKFAIMNPELTLTLPAWQTACGIVDMMAHIFERYFSNTPDCEVTDRVAEGVLTAIMEEAPKVMCDPENYEARANIMWSGTLAHNGVCGTGRAEDWSSHFIEHEISAIYNVAHGAGLAVVVPAWMQYVAGVNPVKVAQFARRVMGVVSQGDDRSVAAEGIKRLKDFFMSIGMPVTFKELGIDNPDIERLVAKLHEHKGERIGGYVKLSADDTIKIYEMMQ
ncbi:iron-containing alcohol dehydrogenase, partial [uncultured Muribaculum sp.]|uniref:iron-containing alcohol dehydrogenase n=1 Tax=uncultured Muribaculum sp. TaxID=1918613 RepID=UPI0025B7420E